VTSADPTPVRGSWRLSLQELAERAGAPVERLERLVELGILAPADTEEPFRSGDMPEPLEYQGPLAIRQFLSTVPAGGALERFRLVPTRANGQPAFGRYLRDAHAPIVRAYGLMVLTLSGSRVAAITGFPDTSVFRSFGLPRTLRE
jgi:hypothetical protein